MDSIRTMKQSDLRHEVERVVREVLESRLSEETSAPGVVPLNISARHMHIRQEDLETLFGSGAQLTKLRDLRQPGEFASEQTVAVVGPNRRMFERVRILGPTRSHTQVELSYTDGIYLDMDLPHRLSGDIAGSAPLVLVGPEGVLRLSEGAIRAMRHIHINTKTAADWGLQDGDRVDVRTGGPMSVTFNDVLIRASDQAKLEMHIDTDEGNAAGLDPREANHGKILQGVTNGRH